MSWINLENLSNIAGGDMGFVKAILMKMRTSLPQSVEVMNASLQTGDWAALKAAAHKAKSSFAYLDIQSVRQQLQEIESSAMEGEKHPNLKNMVFDVTKTAQEIFREMDEKLAAGI